MLITLDKVSSFNFLIQEEILNNFNLTYCTQLKDKHPLT